MRKFYAEVKTKQGRTLSPSALTGIRAAVHRFITLNNRAINILKDSDFIPANNMFQAKCKLYYRSGNPKPTHKNAIEDGDMKKLSRYFIQQNDGNTSALYESAATTFWTPERLQQYVWFNLCYHFGRRGRQGSRELSKTSYEIILDDVGKRCVRIRQAERTKNYQGGSRQSDQDYHDVRMYETDVNSQLDPVNSYEFYISKLNPGTDPLFQTPKKVCDAYGCWFKCEPLGKNVITKMMPILSRKAGLPQVYTNHCVRASTVTALHKAEIEGRRICELTKHKNESSLAHYVDGSSSAQKRECSEILSGSLIGGQPRSSSTLVRHQNSTITNSAAANSAHQGMSTLSSPNASGHIGTLNIFSYSLPQHQLQLTLKVPVLNQPPGWVKTNFVFD